MPSYTGMTARLFFMLEDCAHREPRDTWQRQSSLQSGGEIQRHRIRGSVRAHLSQEARSRVIGHVAAPKPTSVGR
jgi:hypothetical protein